MISHQIIAPPKNLSKYVRFFWVGDIKHDSSQPLTHLEVANSKPQLLFRVAGEYVHVDCFGKEAVVSPASLFAQSEHHAEYRALSSTASFTGVRFYPYAMPALFGITANEISNRNLGIDTLLGKDGLLLMEKMIEAGCAEQRIHTLTKYLESKVKNLMPKYESTAHTIRMIHQSRGRLIIPELVSAACLSERQFERTFKELAGFTAKTYLKIVRFENTIESFTSKITNRTRTIKDLATEGGYYDQAHFNHEFKILAGLTPSAYLKRYAGTSMNNT